MRNIIFFAALFFIFGCTRQSKEISYVELKVPSKVSGFVALPVGRKACYGVSIRGPGITGTGASTCKPEVGTTFGFVESGGILQGQVLKGDSRVIDVYVYLQAVGENLPCPSMATGFGSIPSTSLYKIATKENISLKLDTESLTIETTFPGESQHLVAVNSYPVSCVPTSSVSSNYQVSSAMDTATGGSYILQGRVGKPNNGTVLTGGTYILRVKN